MRHVLLILLSAIALTAAAHNYKKDVYAAVSDGNISQADSLLTVWEKDSPEDPDLYTGKYWTLSTKALQSAFSPLEDGMQQLDMNKVDQGLMNEALTILNKGIKKNPSRIDYYVDKAFGAHMIDDTRQVNEACRGIINHLATAKYPLDLPKLDYLREVNSSDDMLELLHDFEGYLLSSDQADSLLDYHNQVLTDDVNGWLLKGLQLQKNREYPEAIIRFEKALQLNPANQYAKLLIAYNYMQLSQSDKALAICEEVLATPDLDPQDKMLAEDIIQMLTAEPTQMSLYQFEYRFLIMVCRELRPSAKSAKELNDPKYIIDDLLTASYYRLDLKPADVQSKIFGEGKTAVVVWTMPYPEDIPLARYIAFVPDPDKDSYRVITFEKSMELDGVQYWALGESLPEGSHGNHGFFPLPDSAKAFYELVMTQLQAEEADTEE